MTGTERRALILEAAAHVFGERGFEASRMEDVAELAGVAKGLLYKHFPSKDALFEALLDEQGRRFADELASAIAGEGAVQDVLHRALSLWVQKVADPGHVRFVDPGAHDAYDLVRNRIREVVAGVIRAVEPRVHEGAAWLVAAALQGAAESAGLAWSQRPGSVSPDEAVALLARFCWSGLSGLQELLPDDADVDRRG